MCRCGGGGGASALRHPALLAALGACALRGPALNRLPHPLLRYVYVLYDSAIQTGWSPRSQTGWSPRSLCARFTVETVRSERIGCNRTHPALSVPLACRVCFTTGLQILHPKTGLHEAALTAGLPATMNTAKAEQVRR
jgi:hypothetical protein